MSENTQTTDYLLSQVAKLIEDTSAMSSEIDVVFKGFNDSLREIKASIEGNKNSLQIHDEQLKKLQDSFVVLVNSYKIHRQNLAVKMKKIEQDLSRAVKKPKASVVLYIIMALGGVGVIAALIKTFALAIRDFFVRIFGG